VIIEYQKANRGYHIAQHGYHHDYFEFDRDDHAEIERRLDQGARLLTEAGFPAPRTFVAPYDKLSRVSLQAVAGRFAVLSTAGSSCVDCLPPGSRVTRSRKCCGNRTGRLAGRGCSRIPAVCSPVTGPIRQCCMK